MTTNSFSSLGSTISSYDDDGGERYPNSTTYYNNSTTDIGETTISDYEDALVRLAKLRHVNSTSLMTCNPNLEIGWREPADLVPRHLGNKCEPWWVRDAVYLLDRIIKPNWRVLEWGAGSSTVWFAQHAGSVTTIEDSGEWVRDLGFILKNHSITNVELRHRARQTNGTMPSASRGCCYDDYIRGAVDLPNASFDLVSVDGRARERCLEEAVRLVNPIGGVLVLDNSVRDRYQKPMEDFIPQTWLRHEAHLLHNVTAQQKKWVDRDDLFTTFWITRR